MLFTAAAVLLIVPVIYPPGMLLLLFTVFLPAWILAVTLAAGIYGASITPRNRSFSFRFLAAICISGMGFAADLVLVNGLQEIPILSFAGALWAIWLVTNSGTLSQEREPQPADVIPFVLIPVIVLFSILIYRFLDVTISAGGNPLAFERLGKLPALTIAIAASLLYVPTVSSISGYVSSVSGRFLDSFGQALIDLENTGEKMTIDGADQFLNKHLSVHFIAWFRQRNLREYTVVSNRIPPPFDHGDRFFLEGKLEETLRSDGIIHLTPVCLEEFTTKQKIFSKIVPIVDKRDLVISRGGTDTEGKSFLPIALFFFFPQSERMLSSAEVRNFNKLAQILARSAAKKWEEDAGEIAGFPPEVLRAGDFAALAHSLKNRLPGILEMKEFSLYVKKYGMTRWTAYDESGESSELLQINPDERRDWKTDDAGLLKAGARADGMSISVLPLSTTATEALLTIALDDENSIYEKEDRRLCKKVADELGPVVDRIGILMSLKARMADLETASASAKQNLEDHRSKVAESIHDTIAQEMFAAKTQIHILEKSIKDSPPETREEIENLKSMVSEALKNSRRLIQELYSPKDAEKEKTRDEIEDFLVRIRKETGIALISSGLEILDDLKSEQANDLHLVIREGINNVRKHSKAEKTVIRLRKNNDQLSFIIANDERRTPPAALQADNTAGSVSVSLAQENGHFGLRSIEERCKKWGGRLFTRSSPGRGFVLNGKMRIK